MSSKSTYVRARLALAVAAREMADMARGIVGDMSTPMQPGERIRAARRLRGLSLTVVDRAVLAELTDGATWDQVATALGLADGDEAQRRYGHTWGLWEAGDHDDDADFADFGVGLHGDVDMPGTADALDYWWRRHAEPWETVEGMRPVAGVLVDRQDPPAHDR